MPCRNGETASVPVIQACRLNQCDCDHYRATAPIVKLCTDKRYESEASQSETFEQLLLNATEL